jgi:hypothetical protein
LREQSDPLYILTTSSGDRITCARCFAAISKPIIDEIDREIDGVLAEHYGFTDEELDFIINYDITCRMGWDGLAGGGRRGRVSR